MHPGKDRANYLSPLALRVCVRDIILLQQAGTLSEAEQECWLALEEERRAVRERSIGQEMSVDEYAGIASNLLGVNHAACEQAALDVIFPNRAQVVARVLRAWAKDLKRPTKPARGRR